MDPTFWAFVGLLVFIGLIVYLKVPERVLGDLDTRSENIRTEIEEARRLREEAQALLADYRRKVQNAEREAEDIVKQARVDAERMAEQTRQTLDEMLARRTTAAQMKIAQARTQAIEDVKARASDVAVAAAARILAKQMEGDAGEALLSRSIRDVSKRLN